MKKRLKQLLPSFLLGIGLIFCFHSKAKAALEVNIYNGDYTASAPSYPAGSCDPVLSQGYKLCRFSLINGSQRGIRVSFVYYTGSSYTIMGNSLDIWKSNPYAAKGIKHMGRNDNTKVASGGNALSLNSFFAPYEYNIMPDLQLNSKWLTNKFLNQEVMEAYAIALTGKSLAEFNLPNEPADPTGKNPAKVGYRFLIEPIRGYTDGSNFYVMTLTEYARLMKSGTPLQSFYLTKEDVLFTTFEDIGIKPVVPCSENKKCTANEVANPQTGHALQIIDFLNHGCNYETGEGFPKDKPRGTKLTEQEEKCCKEELQLIKDKYKSAVKTPQQCMIVSDSVSAFVNCMGMYFEGSREQTRLWEEEKKKLLEFDQKYPACSGVGCNFEELIPIEETYVNCIESMDRITWMNSIIECKDTTCEINYKRELYVYKGKYELCDITEWEKKIATHNCKQTIVCDEDNPNHFPKEACEENPDLSCCLYFEDQMREMYGSQGLTQPEIDKLIDDWFNEPGKEFRKNCLCADSCDINDSKLTEDCCKELMEKYPNRSKEFWIAKGCADPDECTWEDYADQLIEQLKQMLSADCSVGSSTKIEANDTKRWDCIYDSSQIEKGTKKEVFRDYFIKLKNPYCSVYCREDVEYDFPDGSMIVNAGSHFTVGETGHDPEWKNVKFISTRTCRTATFNGSKGEYGVNFKQFERDWPKANEEVRRTWEEYAKAEIKYNLVLDGFHTGGECGVYDDLAYYYVTTDTGYFTKVTYDSNTGEESSTRKEELVVRYCPTPGSSGTGTYLRRQTKLDWIVKRLAYYRAVEELKKIEYDILACTDWQNFDMIYRIKKYPTKDEVERVIREAARKYHEEHKDDDDDDRREANQRGDVIQVEIDALIEKYGINNQKIGYYDTSHSNILAKYYQKYNSYEDMKKYREFSPDLTLEYEEPTYSGYNYSDFLLKKESVKESANFSTEGSILNNKAICNEGSSTNKRSCKNEEFQYGSNGKIEAIYTKTVEYTLQDGVFDTILKPQGIAVNDGEYGSSSNQIYIALGYSALHVHFMTPTGRYNIGLTYPGFTPGINASESVFEHNFDKLVDDSNYAYDCTYQVYNKIIENDDPDCVGDNCEPCSGNNCYPCNGDNCDPAGLKGLNLIYRPISLGNPFPGISGEGRTPGENWNDTSLIENFITKNRGVNGSAVYQKAPMYQITLTPAIIQQIRKYNETTTYNDFNMDCTLEGKECKSYFLRDELENGSYNFSKYFQKCTISGNRGSTTCCGIGNWNDCDDQDGITRR